MTKLSKSAVVAIFSQYGKQVESNNETILAKGTVDVDFFDSFRLYEANDKSYRTAFVTLGNKTYATDVKCNLPESNPTSFVLAAVAGKYKGEEYTKLRILEFA